MKTKDKKDLRTKTIPELQTLLTQKGEEFEKFTLEKARNLLKNTRLLFVTRKEIAQIATVLREKKLMQKGK